MTRHHTEPLQSSVSPGFSVGSGFPGGSIEVVSAASPDDIQLRLVKDPGGKWYGHYHFRVTGAKGLNCRFRILDVANLAPDYAAIVARRGGQYSGPWDNTGPHISYDRENWFRVPGRLENGDYLIEHRPEYDICYYAEWAPYSVERELNFLAKCQLSARVRAGSVGKTVMGADIDLITINEGEGPRRTCWIVARQHPGETMSGYFLEGFLRRMLDEHDPVVRQLLAQATFYVVPNMNPDGSARAHTRVNGAETDLNRQWSEPDAAACPEVYCVRQKMEQTGVDFFMDCHGDNELPCVFLAGPLEIPSRSQRLARLFKQFEIAWSNASPDYEMGHPYPGGAPAQANMACAWNWVAERFDCLGVLLEQPYKDTSWAQDPLRGWSPQRADRLGASLVTALNLIIDELRAD